MIYLDTSALAKLVVEEAETAALTAWLRARTGQLKVTSAVGHIELARLALRYHATPRATQLLVGVHTIPLDTAVAAVAASLQPGQLRTLDAIHAASALSVRDELTAFCCYDRRLVEAAHSVGLAVESPA